MKNQYAYDYTVEINSIVDIPIKDPDELKEKLWLHIEKVL